MPLPAGAGERHADWIMQCYGMRRWLGRVKRLRDEMARGTDDRTLCLWKWGDDATLVRANAAHRRMVEERAIMGEQTRDRITLADKRKDRLAMSGWRGIEVTTHYQHLDAGCLAAEYERVSEGVRSLCNTGYKRMLVCAAQTLAIARVVVPPLSVYLSK